MRFRDHAAAAMGVIGRILLALDVYLAARLPGDRRPLMFHILTSAAWLGHTWRRCLDEVRIRRYGPGRGLIAVVINRKDNPHV